MHNHLSLLTSRILFITFSLLYALTGHSQLVFTSPPRESLLAGIKQYQPLASYLSKLLNQKVVYQHPKSWLYYQRDMRADKFDIIFDGPHFISWRIEQLNHTPLVKLPGKLRFIVITKKQDKHLSSLQDLVNQKLCVIAPPNLATMTIQAEYPNPVHQPKLVTAKRGGMNGVYRLFKENKCVAAVLRDQYYYKKVPESEKAKLKIIFTSKAIANQGISVSNRVSAPQQQKIIAALTQPNKAIQPILKRFTPKAKNMIKADKEEYKDYYKLLSDVIFGWQIKKTREFTKTEPKYTQAN